MPGLKVNQNLTHSLNWMTVNQMTFQLDENFNRMNFSSNWNSSSWLNGNSSLYVGLHRSSSWKEMRTSLSANLFREWLKYRQDNVTKQYNSNCFTPFIPYTHTTGGHEHNSNVSFKKGRWTNSGINLGSPTDLEEFCHTKCTVATKITSNCALFFFSSGDIYCAPNPEVADMPLRAAEICLAHGI